LGLCLHIRFAPPHFTGHHVVNSTVAYLRATIWAKALGQTKRPAVSRRPSVSHSCRGDQREPKATRRLTPNSRGAARPGVLALPRLMYGLLIGAAPRSAVNAGPLLVARI